MTDLRRPIERASERAALVTGASRGIGLAIAQRLVANGVQVAITGREAASLAVAVDELGGPDHAIGIRGNIGDPEHREGAVSATLEAFGRLDYLVNNTGINPAYGPLADLDLDIARKTVDINVVAALNCTQLAYRAWMAEHGGAVCNVASLSALRPAPGIAWYGATKAMLVALTEGLAVELAPKVRVNAVAPAVVRTRFAEALYAEKEDEVSATYPLRRLGVPDDVAASVVHLLADDASWVTGQTLVLDGGLSLAGGMA